MIATAECSVHEDHRQADLNWHRDEAQNLMTNWLSTGAKFDGVIANNDEMRHRRDPGDEGGRHAT